MPRGKSRANAAGASVLIEQARSLDSEFPDKKSMPMAVARKIGQLLDAAEEAMDWQLPSDVKSEFAYLSEPQRGGFNPAHMDIPEGGLSVDNVSGYGQTKLWTPNGGRPMKNDEAILDRLTKAAGPKSWPSDEDWRLGYLGALAMGDSKQIAYYGAYSEAKAMSTSGSVLVPAPIAAEVIDKIRVASVTQRLGARTVPMSNKTLTIPRLTGDPTIAWLAEGAQITAADASMDSVTLTAQRLTGLTLVSQELYEDSDPVAVGTVLRDSFGKAMAVELDRAVLRGSGTPPEPKGIRYQTGVSVNTTAAAAAMTVVTERAGVLLAANVEPDRLGVAVNPASYTTIMSATGSDGQFIRPPKFLENIQILPTSALAAPATGELYMGAYDEVIVGVRVSFEFKVLLERYAEYGQVGFLPRIRADVAVRHGASFAVRTALSS
jgi:HK97 family phage major capsid protein